MDQLTLSDFIPMESELIICSLSEGYHWLRITIGCTPHLFSKHVQFELGGYDYLYENTPVKDEIIREFDGSVQVVSWKKATGGEENE